MVRLLKVGVLLSIGTLVAVGATITPPVQQKGPFKLVVKEYKNNLLFFVFNRQKGMPPGSRLKIFTPIGVREGGKIFRGRGIYYLIPEREGRYRILLLTPNSQVQFGPVAVHKGEGSLSTQSIPTRPIPIQLHYRPTAVDVGTDGRFFLQVITPPQVTKVVMVGLKSHPLSLREETPTKKVWEWRGEFQPNEVPPEGRKLKRLKVVAFIGGRAVGEKGVSFPIFNSGKITPPIPPARVRYIVRTCSPRYRYQNVHLGTDFVVPAGTPVYSVCPGVVVKEEGHFYSPNYDHNSVIIVHHQCRGRDFYGYYGHTRGVVGVGTHLSGGQLIGYVQRGNREVDSHLHFGVSDRLVTSHWGIGLSPNCARELRRGGFWSTQQLINFSNWRWIFRKRVY